MLPLRRDLRFRFQPHRVLDWHRKGRMVSQYLNTWSLLFPVGERFFIHSVRSCVEEITDADLRVAVQGFIGQEAMHGREHAAFNQALQTQGMPVAEIEGMVFTLLEQLKRLPRSMQLSATIALEHFTAIMGARVLEDVHGHVGSTVDAQMTAMWNWHALEETEHKAVAFDVYRQVVGDGVYAEALRMLGLVLATALFFTLSTAFYLRMLRADPVTGPLGTLRGWRSLASALLGRDPGALRRSVRDWLDYFRPGFHPWDHDNHDALAGLDALLASLPADAERARAA